MRHRLAPLMLITVVAVAASCATPNATSSSTSTSTSTSTSLPLDQRGANTLPDVWPSGTRLAVVPSPAFNPGGPTVTMTWRENEVDLRAYPNDHSVQWVNYYIEKDGNKLDFYSVESTSRMDNFRVTIYKDRFYAGKWKLRAFAHSRVDYFHRSAFWMPYPSQIKEGKTTPWAVDWDAPALPKDLDRPVDLQEK